MAREIGQLFGIFREFEMESRAGKQQIATSRYAFLAMTGERGRCGQASWTGRGETTAGGVFGFQRTWIQSGSAPHGHHLAGSGESL